MALKIRWQPDGNLVSLSQAESLGLRFFAQSHPGLAYVWLEAVMPGCAVLSRRAVGTAAPSRWTQHSQGHLALEGQFVDQKWRFVGQAAFKFEPGQVGSRLKDFS